MPWRETERVNERMKFIVAHQSGMYSMKELCVRFCISREAATAGFDATKPKVSRA